MKVIFLIECDDLRLVDSIYDAAQFERFHTIVFLVYVFFRGVQSYIKTRAMQKKNVSFSFCTAECKGCVKVAELAQSESRQASLRGTPQESAY